MDQKTIAALPEKMAPFVPLGEARRETLSLLVLGLLSARTTNLSVLACERTAAARTASTYRWLQRFFQHADPGEDWAAPAVAGLAGLAGPRRLILDRTTWKIGRREVNLLVLAVATRRHRLALIKDGARPPRQQRRCRAHRAAAARHRPLWQREHRAAAGRP